MHITVLIPAGMPGPPTVPAQAVTPCIQCFVWLLLGTCPTAWLHVNILSILRKTRDRDKCTLLGGLNLQQAENAQQRHRRVLALHVRLGCENVQWSVSVGWAAGVANSSSACRLETGGSRACPAVSPARFNVCARVGPAPTTQFDLDVSSLCVGGSSGQGRRPHLPPGAIVPKSVIVPELCAPSPLPPTQPICT